MRPETCLRTRFSPSWGRAGFLIAHSRSAVQSETRARGVAPTRATGRRVREGAEKEEKEEEEEEDEE
eukprot:8862887-Pyramimonas_sp.AAC.1